MNPKQRLWARWLVCLTGVAVCSMMAGHQLHLLAELVDEPL